MRDDVTDGSVGTLRWAYFGVFIWSLMGAFLAVWFNPRIALPFFALTASLLLIIPFDAVLFGTVVFALIHNPSFQNPLEIYIGGLNVWFLEIAMVFVFASLFIEILTRKRRIEISPMFIVIGVYFISIVAQTIRGYTMGYDISEVRTSFRNALYPIMILPIGCYFGSGGSTKRFIKMLFIGWVLALFFYFLQYFGIFLISRTSLTGRLAWAPLSNIMLFFPLIIVLINEKKISFGENAFYWIILLISFAVLITSQTRLLYVAIAGELLIIIPLLAVFKPKGKRAIFVLKILLGLTAIGVLSIMFLKFAKGDSFDIFLKSVTNRALSLFEWRKDLSIASRRYQIYESLKMIQKNWIFGRGIGVEWYSLLRFGQSRIDGLYFMLMVHQGLVGIGLFFTIFILWFQRSLFLLFHRNLIKDTLEKNFILAQPAFIIAILVHGIGSSAAYVLPTNTILIFSCAMITEKIYSGVKEVSIGVKSLDS
ncbi:O-antigen ligase family protein [bacterium]|nr:O-antigen ligase family protein [bacterium]